MKLTSAKYREENNHAAVYRYFSNRYIGTKNTVRPTLRYDILAVDKETRYAVHVLCASEKVYVSRLALVFLANVDFFFFSFVVEYVH